MSRLVKLLTAALTCGAILVPGAAGAATLVNGNFETGTLSGWNQTATPAGRWITYSGNVTPLEQEELKEEEEKLEAEYEECLEGAIDPEECEEEEPQEPNTFFTPPQGTFAAVSEQFLQSSMVLYQDVALDPGAKAQLSMTLYYVSHAVITVPSPNVLDYEALGGEDENQQLRVDVIKPEAPIYTMNPSDILATVFANKVGDPQVMAPTSFTADLSAFAGQTVRIRIANAVTESEFNSGVDDVSITTTPPSNAFTKGKLKLNKKKGTATVSVTVPGPGVLSLADAKKGKKKVLKPAKLTATGAGVVKVPIKANGKGKKSLKANGKLQFKGKLTFTPTGGTAATQTVGGKLKLTLPKPK